MSRISSMPLVSILCAVKNEALFITDAIQSVAVQDYSHIELICIDDFSSDNTSELIEECAYLDDRIKFFPNKMPGKNNAYNLAFQYSRGDYIVFFAGDDLMTKNSISSRLRSMLGSENIDIASGRIQSFQSFSTGNSHKKAVTYPRQHGYNPSGGCIIMRRKMAEEVFPIPYTLPNEDSWIELHRLYLEKKAVFTPDIVLLYRMHEGNSTRLIRKSFAEASHAIHERKRSLEVFLLTKQDLLNEGKIQCIERKIALESLRYDGKTFSILLFKTNSLNEKIYNLGISLSRDRLTVPGIEPL